jgi:TfoX/Sxy family transcriptional regulator of competence genes
MTPSDQELVERVRAILVTNPQHKVVEKNVMGSPTFMVDGNMCCSVGKGRLMVRVGPAAYKKALTEPDVTPLKFGAMAPVGYVCVASDAVQRADSLRRWIGRGLKFVATLPPKSEKKKRKDPVRRTSR